MKTLKFNRLLLAAIMITALSTTGQNVQLEFFTTGQTYGTIDADHCYISALACDSAIFGQKPLENYDLKTVGTTIWRSAAIDRKVLGQFGCDSYYWSAKPGSAFYTISTKGLATLYLKIRYSKYSAIEDSIYLFMVNQAGVRQKIGAFLPGYSGSWNVFLTSNWIPIHIPLKPIISVGSDKTICEDQSVSMAASASYSNSVAWSSTGDGTFSSTTILNPVYTPGPADIQAGGVTLWLSSQGNYGYSTTDSMALIIQKHPIADAGADASICEGESIQLAGSAQNHGSILWTTTGTGTYSSPGSLYPVYTPGTADVIAGAVTLTLTVAAVSPCTIAATDLLTLNINYCHDLVISSGWSGVSTFVEPVDADLETIFSNVINDLTILYSQTGVFWPGQNLNTIGQWNRLDGYSIKVASQIDLRIAGSRAASRTLQLSQGWNLIPVLSECEAEVVSLFAGTNLVIVKEVAGWQLYWPALNINTLGNLQPGTAYFVLMSSPAIINFPACASGAMSPGGNSNNCKMMEDFINASPWNIFARTAQSHIIGVAKNSINPDLIKPGDLLGAFDQLGQCFGIVKWEGCSTSLIAFGDDVSTQVKDGFLPNEPLDVRLFDGETSEEYALAVTWDDVWPQQAGLFESNGLSVISGLKVGATHIYEQGDFDVLIYPNPARDLIHLNFTGLADKVLVTVYNTNGCLVAREVCADQAELSTSNLDAGIYVVKITSDTFTFIRKLIIQ